MWNTDEEVYCRNCGQLCKPEHYYRPSEDYDAFPGMKHAYRSPCCKDELSEDPVSDRCDQCGTTVDCSVPDKDMEHYRKEWGMTLCDQCYNDIIVDRGHDMEYQVARAEYMEDR
jgi:hypothetical protein